MATGSETAAAEASEAASIEPFIFAVHPALSGCGRGRLEVVLRATREGDRPAVRVEVRLMSGDPWAGAAAIPEKTRVDLMKRATAWGARFLGLCGADDLLCRFCVEHHPDWRPVRCLAAPDEARARRLEIACRTRLFPSHSFKPPQRPGTAVRTVVATAQPGPGGPFLKVAAVFADRSGKVEDDAPELGAWLASSPALFAGLEALELRYVGDALTPRPAGLDLSAELLEDRWNWGQRPAEVHIRPPAGFFGSSGDPASGPIRTYLALESRGKTPNAGAAFADARGWHTTLCQGWDLARDVLDSTAAESGQTVPVEIEIRTDHAALVQSMLTTLREQEARNPPGKDALASRDVRIVALPAPSLRRVDDAALARMETGLLLAAHRLLDARRRFDEEDFFRFESVGAALCCFDVVDGSIAFIARLARISGPCAVPCDRTLVRRLAVPGKAHSDLFILALNHWPSQGSRAALDGATTAFRAAAARGDVKRDYDRLNDDGTLEGLGARLVLLAERLAAAGTPVKSLLRHPLFKALSEASAARLGRDAEKK